MMKRMCVVAGLMLALAAAGSGQTHWVSAYFAGWAKYNATPVDIPQIDFTCATHWIFFSLVPTSAGTFDGTANSIDTTRMRQFAAAVHAAGKKAIIGTGGWGADYTGAVTHSATSIAYLANLMKAYGYDGVDIDWEPVPSAQYTNFAAWIKALKSAMLAGNPQALLTAAAMGTDQALINNQQYFDQINLMTYDMSGPWPGWVSWHNSAIYTGGNTFPSTGGPVPSIDGSVGSYLTAGVPAAKIGFGIEFYGYIWNAVTGPMQTGFGTVQNTVPYAQIMDTYAAAYPLKWDNGAQAAYFSTASQFVSFDAETTLTAKAHYLQTKGLGGVIVFEAAAAIRASQPAGSKDHLLQALKAAFLGGTTPPPADTVRPVVAVTSPVSGAVVSGTVTVRATASDNIGVAGVQFQVDGKAVGSEVTAVPYALAISTLGYANGSHAISAVARDAAGNRGTASVAVTVSNAAPPPPASPGMVVFDESLHAPFTNTSWSASANFANAATVGSDTTMTVKVTYSAWGGFDLLSGTWSSEHPISPATYDSLKFDAFVPAGVSFTVGFYTGATQSVSTTPGQWRTYAVPLPAASFVRFYIQSSSAATVYFDNIRFSARPVIAGTGETTSLTDDPAGTRSPSGYSLEQNFPNPFNPSTVIRFAVPAGGHVTLAVYDVLGNEVARLVDEDRQAGTYEVMFDAASGRGIRGALASGVYFYRLTAGDFTATRRLLLVK